MIHTSTKGDSFAVSVALSGGRFPTTAEAVSDVRVVRVPADHIVRCIRENPDIALAMIASASEHLHHLMEQVEQLKAQSGVQRVPSSSQRWPRSITALVSSRYRSTRS